MKAAQDRVKTTLREEDAKLILEGLIAIDPGNNNPHASALREQMSLVARAAKLRREAGTIEAEELRR